MFDNREICGTCYYHEHEHIDAGWVCTNKKSEYCACWTEYDDKCEEWEDRNDKSW